MRPFGAFPTGAVVVGSPAFARLLAEVVARGTMDLRRDGLRATPELVEFVDTLREFAGCVVEVPQVVPAEVPAGSEAVRWVSVGASATTLGVSERFVRGLAHTRRLGRSRKGPDGAWQIDAEAVEARAQEATMKTPPENRARWSKERRDRVVEDDGQTVDTDESVPVEEVDDTEGPEQ